MAAGPITFVYTDWVAEFPEFTAVTSGAAQGYFNLASLFISNGSQYNCSPIQDPAMLTQLLYLTTAHLAKLFSAQTNGVPTTGGVSPPNQVVGRVASATEGSVTASLEMEQQAANAAWWNQTPYGAAVWVLLKPFRLFRYVAPTRRRVFNYPVRPWGRLGGI